MTNTNRTADAPVELIQSAIAALLSALGFTAMAVEASNESDFNTLRRYARIILKNTSNADTRRKIEVRFAALRLV